MTDASHASLHAPMVPAPGDGSPRWGLGDAAVGWVMAQTFALLGALVLAAAYGYSQSELADNDVSLTFTALQFPPLWLGFVGVPIWAAATKGAGWVADFAVRLRAIDVPVGVAAGLLAQFVVVPLVSLPLIWLTNTDLDKLGEPARDLGAKANSPGLVVLLFLMVAVGAPIAEEIFFRGLLLRALEKRFGTVVAVVGSSVVFGATHFQALQLPALAAAGVVFALLTVRTERLGPAIVAHMAFNAATVASIVWGPA